MSTIKPIEKMSYEEAYTELEMIVASLESGDQTLDGSTTIFTRGQALIKHCAELLEKAEMKVTQLTGEPLKEQQEPA
jgi:exodeoxyribonuclease VII small subunit